MSSNIQSLLLKKKHEEKRNHKYSLLFDTKVPIVNLVQISGTMESYIWKWTSFNMET